MKNLLPFLPAVRRVAFAAILVMAATGCAEFNRFDYRTAVVTPPRPSGPSTIAIAVLDRRPDFLGNNVSAAYVGLTRDAFAIPFRVYTKSRAPLASDLNTALVDGLRQSGWTVTSVPGDAKGSTNATLARLHHTHASRQILVTLHQWESDTLIHTDLDVNVGLMVFNSRGDLLAMTHFVGTQSLGGSVTPVRHARESILRETGLIMSRLLHARSVAAVL